MAETKKDASEASHHSPLQADATEGRDQLGLDLRYLPGRQRGTPGWLYRKHLGYYCNGWQCERCGGYWESFLALRDAPECYARPVQAFGASK